MTTKLVQPSILTMFPPTFWKQRMIVRNVILCKGLLSVLINRVRLLPSRVQQLWLLFITILQYRSHKYLFGESGAAA